MKDELFEVPGYTEYRAPGSSVSMVLTADVHVCRVVGFCFFFFDQSFDGSTFPMNLSTNLLINKS